jgi:hypothetical protein
VPPTSSSAASVISSGRRPPKKRAIRGKGERAKSNIPPLFSFESDFVLFQVETVRIDPPQLRLHIAGNKCGPCLIQYQVGHANMAKADDGPVRQCDCPYQPLPHLCSVVNAQLSERQYP